MLSGLLMSSFLIFGSIFMVYHAILSFLEPQKVHSLGMLGLAVLGIVINGFAFWKMKNNGESHHHEDLHNHTKDETNFNHNSIMLHLLEDVLGWVAVLF